VAAEELESAGSVSDFDNEWSESPGYLVGASGQKLGMNPLPQPSAGPARGLLGMAVTALIAIILAVLAWLFLSREIPSQKPSTTRPPCREACGHSCDAGRAPPARCHPTQDRRNRQRNQRPSQHRHARSPRRKSAKRSCRPRTRWKSFCGRRSSRRATDWSTNLAAHRSDPRHHSLPHDHCPPVRHDPRRRYQSVPTRLRHSVARLGTQIFTHPACIRHILVLRNASDTGKT